MEISETTMREMAKIALEQAMETIAGLAEKMAPESKILDGEQALIAFAAAMRSSNGKTWPIKGAAS